MKIIAIVSLLVLCIGATMLTISNTVIGQVIGMICILIGSIIFTNTNKNRNNK